MILLSLNLKFYLKIIIKLKKNTYLCIYIIYANSFAYMYINKIFKFEIEALNTLIAIIVANFFFISMLIFFSF
jgi:hypothetical protein